MLLFFKVNWASHGQYRPTLKKNCLGILNTQI